MNGPASVALSQTFSVTVVAQNVPNPGLYGVQFEINFDPSLLSLGNLQPNPDLSFVVRNVVTNTLGKLTFVASRQGNVPGLTGAVTLLTFDATAAASPGVATLTFANEKIGDSQATAFTITSQSYTVAIGGTPTPTPTATATVTATVTPTATTTPGPGTATVSGQVTLQGRASGNWAGATVTVDDSSQSDTTDANGNFSITGVTTGGHSSITADASGFLPAVCTAPIVTAPVTTLAAVALLNGDLNDDNLINIIDATTVGVSFGATGPSLPADLNQDGIVDIFDIIIVSANFGQGSQGWSCLP